MEEGGEGLVEQSQTKNILMAHFQLHALNIRSVLLPLLLVTRLPSSPTTKPSSVAVSVATSDCDELGFRFYFALFEEPVRVTGLINNWAESCVYIYIYIYIYMCGLIDIWAESCARIYIIYMCVCIMCLTKRHRHGWTLLFTLLLLNVRVS